MESLRSEPTKVDGGSCKTNWKEAVHTRRYSGRETTASSTSSLPRQALNISMNAPSPSLLISSPPDNSISSSTTRELLKNHLDEEGTRDNEEKSILKGLIHQETSNSAVHEDFFDSNRSMNGQTRLDGNSGLVNMLQESVMNYESQLRRQRDVNRLLSTQVTSLQEKVKFQQEEIEDKQKCTPPPSSSSALSGQLDRLQELEEIKAILEKENDHLGSKLYAIQQALELEKQANRRHENYKVEVDEKMRVLDIRNSDMMTDVAVLMKERDTATRARDDKEQIIDQLNEEKEKLLDLIQESKKDKDEWIRDIQQALDLQASGINR